MGIMFYNMPGLEDEKRIEFIKKKIKEYQIENLEIKKIYVLSNMYIVIVVGSQELEIKQEI